MNDKKRFEEWLRQAAADPEVRDLLARADAQPPLPEDVLAEYYAGTLSPEELQAIERRASLSQEASAFLADFDADVEAAATAVAPANPLLVRVRVRLASLGHLVARGLGDLARPAPAWRLAASVATVAVLVVVGGRVLDRPPGALGPAYDARPTRGSVQETVTLPGGVVVQVDPAWPLRTPLPAPERVRWFSWDPVQLAASYDLELRDPGGQVLYSRTGLVKSHLRLPWSVRRTLRPGTTYIWIVTARDRDSAPMVRALGRFAIPR